MSTPSRLCLFGEHLDCLGLEVIAAAIKEEDCEKNMKAIEALGYPTKILMQDTGVRKEK